jgi:hypothetical protein
MVHIEDAHVGPPAPSPLLHHISGDVENSHKAHGPGGYPANAAHLVPPGPQMGEGEAGAAAGLVNQGHVPDPLHDAAHVVCNGDDEAGGQLAHGQTGIH